MPRAFVGPISVEVPEGWDDQTLLTLVGPVPQQPALPRIKQPLELRPTVVMKRHRPSAPITLEAYAEAQERMIGGAVPGSEVVARGQHTLIAAGVEALTREVLLGEGSGADRLRQLHLYFFIGADLYLLCGTAPNDPSFEQERKRFLALADGLRLEPSR